MHRIMTVRVDEHVRRRLARVARTRRVKQSDIVRQAIEELLAHEEDRPFQSWRECVGIMDGAPDLSRRTGRRFAEIVKRRRAK
jgi:Arc/MetJ-type ribon-helix-helix transcriptional regulator